MIDWSAQQRVTVLMPTWIGDVCMATPTLQLLRERLPEGAVVTAVVRPGMKPLLHGLASVDDVIQCDPQGVLGPLRAGRRIAETHPDTVLVLPGSFRSALSARFSGRCRRVGYARDGRAWLLTDAIKSPDRSTPRSQIASYQSLVDPDAPEGTPTLAVTDEDRAAAASVMPSTHTPFVVLVPGANREDKRWPAERFAAVANALHTRFGWTTVIAGSASERMLTHSIASTCNGPVVDLAAASGSLGALKAIAADAELMVSNDTGPRHVALAVRTPVISLFGPTDHRWTIIPGAGERRLLAEPFLPQELSADACATACSIDRIVVGDVLGAVDSMTATSTHGG
jgi:heptosyltransferase-2